MVGRGGGAGGRRKGSAGEAQDSRNEVTLTGQSGSKNTGVSFPCLGSPQVSVFGLLIENVSSEHV